MKYVDKKIYDLEGNEIRVAVLPKQPPLPGLDWDWRLAPWQDYPHDDDASPPKEEARMTFKEFLKAIKTKRDPNLDKGLASILGVKKDGS